jgi:DNA-binding transcriptional MerR regulator
MARRPLPDKLFFRIGEVAQLVGVKPHVLRYWEEELGVLAPMKTRGAHRQYRRRDVEVALRVRELLHDEGLTLDGVRRRLREESAPKAPAKPNLAPVDPGRDAELRLRAVLVELRAELVALRDQFDVGSAAARPDAAVGDAEVLLVPPARASERERG